MNVLQVLHEDETISLEGWLDSKADLCPLTIRHKGRIEHAGSHALQVFINYVLHNPNPFFFFFFMFDVESYHIIYLKF